MHTINHAALSVTPVRQIYVSKSMGIHKNAEHIRAADQSVFGNKLQELNPRIRQYWEVDKETMMKRHFGYLL